MTLLTLRKDEKHRRGWVVQGGTSYSLFFYAEIFYDLLSDHDYADESAADLTKIIVDKP
jgi:hypothetical protein